jgi:hypothetical protein
MIKTLISNTVKNYSTKAHAVFTLKAFRSERGILQYRVYRDRVLLETFPTLAQANNALQSAVDKFTNP